MAEIHVLPVRPDGSGQVERQMEDLSAAFTQDRDLGSRAPHIQAGGERLQQLCREFEAVIDDLDRLPIALTSQELTAVDVQRQLLGTVQGLATTAQRFPTGLCF